MRIGCAANGPALPVHRLSAEVAAATPDAVAVICKQDHLTYAALDREANRPASLLHRLGVTRAGVVAFLLPRSIEAIVTMLAVLKVGGTFVPLDPG
jgi:non-ribosomal peptide synthetase component F